MQRWASGVLRNATLETWSKQLADITNDDTNLLIMKPEFYLSFAKHFDTTVGVRRRVRFQPLLHVLDVSDRASLIGLPLLQMPTH
jgi:hypothetical protein